MVLTQHKANKQQGDREQSLGCASLQREREREREREMNNKTIGSQIVGAPYCYGKVAWNNICMTNQISSCVMIQII